MHFHQVGGELAVGLQQVEDAHHVVVHVAQVGPRRVGEALVVLAVQVVQQVPHGPGHAAQDHQLPVHAVEPLGRVAACLVLEDRLLELLEAVGDLFQQGERVVHDRVDQAVEQEARVAAAQP